jgi:hypothetical protein
MRLKGEKMLEFLLGLPLLMAYLFGVILTLLLAIRQKTVSSVLGFLGFLFLLGVRLVLPMFDVFTVRLQGRGMTLTRVGALVALANLAVNLASATAVVCLVGAIALASRSERSL